MQGKIEWKYYNNEENDSSYIGQMNSKKAFKYNKEELLENKLEGYKLIVKESVFF